MLELGNLPAWIAIVISAGTLLFSIINSRSKAASENLAAVSERVTSHEERLTVVEADMKHLPSKDTAYELRLAIMEMNGQVQLLGERIKPVAAIADRLQETIILQMERS